MFAYCVSAAYQEAAPVRVTGARVVRHVERPRVRSKNVYIAELAPELQPMCCARLELRSQLRNVYVLRPHPWALDVTHNAGPRDAHGSGFLVCSRYTVCEHSLTSPEGSGRGEKPREFNE